MEHKFNTVLQARADETKAEEEKQNKLKKKFGIKGKNVVIVERNDTIKFTIKTIGHILHFVATIVVLGFAFIGIIALFYEAPRKEVLTILKEVFQEINRTVPIERFFDFFHGSIVGERIF